MLTARKKSRRPVSLDQLTFSLGDGGNNTDPVAVTLTKSQARLVLHALNGLYIRTGKQFLDRLITQAELEDRTVAIGAVSNLITGK